jgi:hypothetical protein
MGVFAFVFCLVGISKADAANTLSSSVYVDANSNGTVEGVRLTLDENVTTCTYEAGDWAVTVAGSIGVTAVTGITCTGSDAFIDVAITAGAGITGGVTAPTITYANVGTAGSVTLTSGAMTAKSASPTDGAKPQIKTLSYQDTDVDGKVDSMIAIYTETVVAGSVLGANDLSLTNVGDFTGAAFGSLATDLITGSVSQTTVPLGTESTAKDTGDASGTLAVSSQNLFSLVDGTGNTNATLGAQTQATFVDLAKPQIKSITYQDADADSKMDRLDVIYTEPVVAGSNLDTNDLIFTSVGSFTSAALGADLTDLITMTVSSTWVPLGTEASVVATYDTLGTLAISSQNTFSLLDASGNNNTTLGAQTQATFTDGIKPIVISTTPVDNSTSQSKTSSLVVVFSEPMATGATGFTITPSNVYHTPAWSVSDTTLTFSHLSYAGSTEYTAVLTGTTDVATNVLLDSPYSWNFTTVVGNSSSGSSSRSSSTTIKYGEVTPAVPANTETPDGCENGAKFSATTGRNCAAATPAVVCPPGHMYKASTGEKCTSNEEGAVFETPAKAYTYAFGNTLVKQGTKGESCKAWQMYLNDYAGAKLSTDGACGKLTMTAARAWQASVGLTADGLLGAMSRAKANK